MDSKENYFTVAHIIDGFLMDNSETKIFGIAYSYQIINSKIQKNDFQDLDRFVSVVETSIMSVVNNFTGLESEVDAITTYLYEMSRANLSVNVDNLMALAKKVIKDEIIVRKLEESYAKLE